MPHCMQNDRLGAGTQRTAACSRSSLVDLELNNNKDTGSHMLLSLLLFSSTSIAAVCLAQGRMSQAA